MVWPAAIAAGATIAGGLLASSGQKAANKANLKIAREQMAFQERMSSTAYQRSAADLSAAGLNRILAVGSPASSPSGALATMQNEQAALGEAIGEAPTSAIAMRQQRQAIKLATAQTHNVTQAQATARAQELATIATTRITNAKAVREIFQSDVAGDLHSKYKGASGAAEMVGKYLGDLLYETVHSAKKLYKDAKGGFKNPLRTGDKYPLSPRTITIDRGK